MNLPVTLLGVGPCYAYSADGPTHHATEDVAVMRALSNMTIFSPADANMASALVEISLKTTSPLYIRLDRRRYQTLYHPREDLSVGFRIVKEGSDVCIFATGCMVHRALEVEKALSEQAIKACVVDMYRLKPVDVIKLVEYVRSFNHVVTIEEHTLNGGLGSIIVEILSDHGLCLPVKRFGIVDKQLYAYGIRDKLHKQRGIDTESIVRAIQAWTAS